jgi:hypothetical protein
MNKGKELRDFCHNAASYTRLRNSLWRATRDTYWPQRDWDPSVDDFAERVPKAIKGLGAKSREILKAWLDANDE